MSGGAKETVRPRAGRVLAMVPLGIAALLGAAFFWGLLNKDDRLPSTLIGKPVLPALHGGVTGSFLEITALMQLAWDQVLARMEAGGEAAARIAGGNFPPYPKTIDITVDYLRPGLPRETFARATVQKAGRRVANLHVEAWQGSRLRPIAMLRGNFLMPVEG